jgi:alkylation response protein AidB-like acyl-CoA dehydrogenase
MRWALDPDQEMFVDAFSDVLDRAATPAKVRHQLDAADPSEFERVLSDDGWLAIGVGEEAGGQGGGLLELALAAEQLARRAAPSSAWTATALALPALDAARSEAAISEGTFVAIAANAGEPLDAVGTSAAPDAQSSVTVAEGALTGRVDLVLGGDRAGLFVVPAGSDLYLVEASAPGVSVSPRALLDRSRSAADIAFNGTPVTRLDRDAHSFLSTAALRAAVLIAADSLGAATRLRELAVEYSTQRTQFGAPIGSFQAMKHAAATMLVNEEASRSLVYYAAASVETALDEGPLHAAAAKAQVTAAGSAAAESSLTMHGAIGYTWEHDLQLLYKRAKLDVALFGDPARWNERIADALDLVPAR